MERHFVFNYDNNNIIGTEEEAKIASLVPNGVPYYYYTAEEAKAIGAPPETWVLSGTPDGYGTEGKENDNGE